MSVQRQPVVAFTIKYNGIARVITTDVEIFDPRSRQSVQVKAIWDTGASGSVITKAVSQKLGLAPTGKTQVHTANGIAIQNTYTVNIGLPNRAMMQFVTVTEADALSGGCEVLIGMDIINFGDFIITNYKGKTTMSFRIPSQSEIDYAKQINSRNAMIEAHQKSGRSPNSNCICGSGKKFKNCHGKELLAK